MALAALSGCTSGGGTPKVTVTVPPPHTPISTPVVTPEPTPIVTPVSTPTPGATPSPTPIVVPLPTVSGEVDASLGLVAPECTHSVCHYVHIAWSGLTVGNHQVQCVSSIASVGMFSDNSVRFDTSSGQRDLKCFLGHPGSTAWVVIDGTVESTHADWTW